MPEKALYTKNICSITDKAADGFTRIYFGNEFCEHLIPSWEIIKEVLDTCHGSQRAFTLVTPMVTDKGISTLYSLFERLSDTPLMAGALYEVVANDIGVIQLLNQKFPSLQPIAGRLLSKQRRDPRIIGCVDPFGKNDLPLLGHSQFSPLFIEYLHKKNVHRVEIDNLLQGINDTFIPEKLDVSLYFPYTYLTTSRMCFFNQSSTLVLKDAIFCRNHECQKYRHFELHHVRMPMPILLKGNTQFFENRVFPDDVQKWGINRIIYEKDIPL
ncbi:MAG: hypothetical protein JXD21_07620 [Candidatus Omnitrophica bacterium]|nr:hypothetical protein [Candidatus Omnitrophota bacterium]